MDERSSARPVAAPGFIPRPNKPKKPTRPSALPPPRQAAPAANMVEPTLLLVGADSAFEPALRAALARHKVYVETTSADAVAESVIAAAPDLVLLVGPAARDGGAAVLEAMMSSPVSSVVPVAILDDNSALELRLRAFRHGAAAVIAPSASIDAIAEQVARLAREIPERGGDSLGLVGEATLSEFVGALSKELRSGILSVHAANATRDEDAVRLVLGRGRPLAAFIDDFVRQVKSHVVHAEPLRYEFAEHAGGTVALLDPKAPTEPPEHVSVQGVRIALADDDTGRADSVAQELRARGVHVVVTDLRPSDLRFAKLRQVDPEILLIGEAHVKGAGYELLRRMRRDTRLRWASLLVVRWEEIWSDALSVPALDRLETAIAALSEADRTLQAWSQTREPFDARLEITGPARCLRALTASAHPLRLTVNNPRITVSVDLSDGLVVGATAASRSEPVQHWDGALALSALMVLSSGRIHVAPVNQPAQTNVMATIDVALNMADSEPAPITPSIPACPPASLQPPAGELPISTSSAAHASARFASAASPRGQLGIGRATAAFLVALGALQGLIVVAALNALLKSRPTPRPPPEASASSGARFSDALPASTQSTTVPKAELSKAQSIALSPAAETTLPSKGLPIDETGTRAPTCEESLGTSHVAAGDYPGSAYAEMRAANKALVRGDLNAAERSLCRASLWDQKNPEIPLALAQVMLLRRDGAAAVEWAQKSLATEPANGRAEGVLGDGLARVGDYPGAKKAWLASLQIDDTSAAEYRDLSSRSAREARASMDRHDFARAERFFRRAVVLDAENSLASNGLVEALLRFGDTASALRWANRAISSSPRDPATRVLLGDTLYQKGDRGAAEVEWREALQLDPANVFAQRRLSKLARDQ